MAARNWLSSRAWHASYSARVMATAACGIGIWASTRAPAAKQQMLALRQLEAVTDVFYLIRTLPNHVGAWRGCIARNTQDGAKAQKSERTGAKSTSACCEQQSGNCARLPLGKLSSADPPCHFSSLPLQGAAC